MSDEPIAITGIACRFPGEINSPSSFWDFILNKGDAIRRVPDERSSLWGSAEENDYPGYGGFIDKIEYFDAGFFNIAPREARYIDPQQRLLLELAWEALEDARIPAKQIDGKAVGVYTGIFLDEYWDLQRYKNPSQIGIHTNTGGTLSLAANRISYFLNLKGPSLSVDTACSSSLTAIHLACRDIQNGTAIAALAGGANLLLSPQTTRGFHQAQMLSSDGRCRAFDSAAHGYGRSDGGGIVVLKSLSNALKDGNTIYALIHGSAINQDGRTRSLTLPDQRAQEDVIKTAAVSGKVDPHSLIFVEAHGTGTNVGDPIEANAIGRATGSTGCLIGSVKTNIGHTEAAAGVAGLIKTALALNHGVIPPSLHFNCPNPNIPFENLGLEVVTQPYEISCPAYAGVNSFGFGGANAHIVLGSPPQNTSRTRRCFGPKTESSVLNKRDGSKTPAPNSHPQLLLLSAGNKTALKARASDTISFLKNNLQTSSAEVAGTLGLGRTHLDHRLALVFEKPSQAIDSLEMFCAGSYSDKFATGRVNKDKIPIVFVFTGMGPQWYGMGKTVYERYPGFRKDLDHFDELFSELTGWSILDRMMADNNREQILEVEISQPANLGLQWALAKWWISLGLKPQFVLGHSVGEIASACISGALTLKEAVNIIYHRTRLQKPMQGKGEMLAVGMSPDEATEIIKPFGEKVSIAATNSPISVTLVGEKAVIKTLQTEVEQKKLFCRKLNTGVAYHSSQMDRIHEEFVDSIGDLAPADNVVPMLSTVTGGLIQGERLNADHWWRNIRHPVVFDQAFSSLPKMNEMIFVQIGPHPVLSTIIYENLAHLDNSGHILASMRRDKEELEVLSDTAQKCYVNGCDLNWDRFMDPPNTYLAFRSYPWQKEKYWLDDFSDPATGSYTHALISNGIESSVEPKTSVWERRISLDSHPIFADHVVMNKNLIPLTAQIEMLFETVPVDEIPISFTDLKILNPLLLARDGTQIIQIVCKKSQYEISSKSDSHGSNTTWLRNTSAIRSFFKGTPARIDLGAIKARCKLRTTNGRFYELASEMGLNYGSEFRHVEELVHSETEALATISTKTEPQGPYRFHPGILDAGLQAMSLIKSKNETFLPVSVQSILFIRAPVENESLFSYTCFRKKGDALSLIADISLVDKNGRPLVILKGVECSQTRSIDDRPHNKNPYGFYKEKWERNLSWDGPTPPTFIDHWYIFTDQPEYGSSLANILSGNRYKAKLIDISVARLMDDTNVFETTLRSVKHAAKSNVGIIGMWTGTNKFGGNRDTKPALESFQLIRSVLDNVNLPCYLRMITSAAQSVVSSDRITPKTTAIWGCGRVAALEHPELNNMIIDLPEKIEQVDVTSLAEIVRKTNLVGEITLRGTNVYTRRVLPLDLKKCNTKFMEFNGGGEKNYRLNLATPGSINDLHFVTKQTKEPGNNEVSIRVQAVGLNFRDVLMALGLIPDSMQVPLSFGWECVGEVIALGGQVEDLNVGDIVLGMLPGTMAASVTTGADLIVRKPDNLSLEAAATIPVAFLTAYLGLKIRGNITAGDRVLIHNATGGVGLAAVQFALDANTEIFATAGSEEKRDYLRAIGISEVMDSRSERFAEEIMEKTHGQGIDLILNTLAEPGMTASISVLSAHGRFIEIGKSSIMGHGQFDLSQFENNKSYHSIDLAQLIQERSSHVGGMLRSILDMFSESRLKPLPYKVYPMARAPQAFRFMSHARHIGKLVIVDDGASIPVRLKEEDSLIRSGVSYLVTGGMGGVGKFLVGWLIKRGAGKVIVTGRRSRAEIDLGSFPDGKVSYFPVDVTDHDAMDNLFQNLNKREEPIKGIFHAAGILNDGILLNQSSERFNEVLGPKIVGARYLHEITKHMELDMFVLFSSVASMVGTAGQAPYAAGNAYLDGLSDLRRQEGLPVTSINLGPVENTGMMKDSHVRDRLTRQGFRAIKLEEVDTFLDVILRHEVHRVGIIPLSENAGSTRVGRLVAEINPKEGNLAPSTEMSLEEVKKLPDHRLRFYIETFVIDSICSIIEIDREMIVLDKSWRSLGVDSLMAVELRNQIETGLHVSIEVESLQSTDLINQTIEFILAKSKATSRI